MAIRAGEHIIATVAESGWHYERPDGSLIPDDVRTWVDRLLGGAKCYPGLRAIHVRGQLDHLRLTVIGSKFELELELPPNSNDNNHTPATV